MNTSECNGGSHQCVYSEENIKRKKKLQEKDASWET